MNIIDVLQNYDITKTVILLRGIPGSGKSTITNAILRQNPWAMVINADTYHIGPSGEYRWCKEKAGEAHKWCLRDFISWCYNFYGYGTCVIDNTNTSWDECAIYLKMAAASRANILVLEKVVDFDKAFQRNTHNVPLGTVKNMFERLNYATPRIQEWCRAEAEEGTKVAYLQITES